LLDIEDNLHFQDQNRRTFKANDSSLKVKTWPRTCKFVLKDNQGPRPRTNVTSYYADYTNVHRMLNYLLKSLRVGFL